MRRADSILIDSSLRDLVERVLPLGTYYTAIFAFVEHRSHLDYGLVNHALCAAMRDMLKVRHQPISRLCRLTDVYEIGLPNSAVTTRTCIQHLTTILASKALVLRSPHNPYPISNLSSHPGTSDSRRPSCRRVIIIFIKFR